MRLLKNSLLVNPRKSHRARMPYKRFSRLGDRFPITKSSADFVGSEFSQHPRMLSLTESSSHCHIYCFSMSGSLQVLSNDPSSGPYSRKRINQPVVRTAVANSNM